MNLIKYKNDFDLSIIIKTLINEISSTFKDVLVILDSRKEHYLKTLKIRLEYLYKIIII